MKTIWLVSILSVVAANVAFEHNQNPYGGIRQAYPTGAQYPPWFADRASTTTTTTTTTKKPQGGSPPPTKPTQKPTQKPPQNQQGTTQKPVTSKPGSQASKKCAAPRGQFPHEKNCDQYYNCWDETVLVQSCQRGLVFNAKKRYCDYPKNVDCGSRGVSTPPKITSCKTPFGSYRNPKNCSEFYVCSSGTAYKFSCPQGTRYNTNLGVCDYPYKVNCDSPPKVWWVEEESQPAYTEPEHNYYPDNSLGHSEEGSRFPDYEESYQPEYSPPSQAEYHPRPVSPPEPQEVIPEAPAAAGCEPNSVFTLSDGCSSVVACWGGIPTVVNCPEGTSFDTRRQRCDFDYRAQCELR